MPAARLANRNASFTLYGALGECISGSGFYWEIHDSTNGSDFLDFITNLYGEIDFSKLEVRPILLFDNHRAHLGDPIERME